MTSTDITLFDIPSHFPSSSGQRSGSLFTWRVRFALNYKKLTYTTVWKTHDEVEPTCKANAIPLAPGASYYTFPCIIDRSDPSNVVRLMDSRVIVEYLEQTYPDPPLNPSDEQTKDVEQHGLTTLARPINLLLMKPFMSVCPPNVRAHLESVIPTRFGTSLQQMVDAGGEIGSPLREGYWEQVREGLEGFGLKDGDKWLDGEQEPKYKDFIVLSYLMTVYVSDPGQQEGWPKVMSWGGGKWKRYWEAAEQYVVVQ